MTTFPFPTGLYRVFGENPITVIGHDHDGKPTTVCVCVHSPGDRAVALALLESNPESIVVSHGLRYAPDGSVQPYEPCRPSYAGELHLQFDVEWVTLGPRPRVYVFTHTEQEWENARQALRHLLDLGRLSKQSYLEGDHTGNDQGLSAQNLDGKPHGPRLVAQFREAAMCAQNAVYEAANGDDDDPFLLRVLGAREQCEMSAREREDIWGEETD